MRTFAYFICDVFTSTRFGGNPLAVFPEAEGLSAIEMQQIAREFNFSESTFVFPPEKGGTRKVRIFTPTREVPFAGHPNIGTAFILSKTQCLGEAAKTRELCFEEGAGMVPIALQSTEAGEIMGELRAPQSLVLGPPIAPEAVSRALSLSPREINLEAHSPLTASVGLPFVMAELRDLDALKRARIHLDGFDTMHATGIMPDILVYVRDTHSASLRCRMFAPLDGVPEDPATGSANAALAGLLAHLDPCQDGTFSYCMRQGVEMGRPSDLKARAEKVDGTVQATWIGGACVLVSQGELYLGS